MGTSDGAPDDDGVGVGFPGKILGLSLGAPEDMLDGNTEGTVLGTLLGLSEATLVGRSEGLADGTALRTTLEMVLPGTLGLLLESGEGKGNGSADGLAFGSPEEESGGTLLGTVEGQELGTSLDPYVMASFPVELYTAPRPILSNVGCTLP